MEIENKFDKITKQEQNNVVNFNIVTNNISQPMNTMNGLNTQLNQINFSNP
jgi:hypothetical protein